MEMRLELKNTERNDYYYEEAIKTLRTNIQFCGSSLKTILFTSTVSGEGKSATTVAVASSLGSIGSQYLSGQKKLGEVIYHTNMENVDMILAGPYSPNPAELLEDELFKVLLENARELYDYIIIDTPPMLNLIDGAIIANQCDGAVIVVESGGISYRMAQKVKSQLEKSGCRILGAVLNRVGGEYGSGYYKKYYGKYYKKYYGKYGKYERYGYDSPKERENIEESR